MTALPRHRFQNPAWWTTLLVAVLLVPATTQAAACRSAKRGLKSSMAIARYLRDLADSSFGYAAVTTLGATACEGKPVTAILITENASWERPSGKPAVVLTGAIHGNEWATPEVCIGIAEYLLDHKDDDTPARDDKGVVINAEALAPPAGRGEGTAGIVPRITSIKELLQRLEVIIIPVLNPEGYDYSQTPEGRMSYYGAGWRPNRCEQQKRTPQEICYQADGRPFATPPADAEHCFLADFDDTAEGGELEEEEVIVCETVDHQGIRLFAPELDAASAEMFDAIYSSRDPRRVFCASGRRHVWQAQWSAEDKEIIPMARAVEEGYLQEAYGVDLNRNFRYQWDMGPEQKAQFIRTRTPSSRVYRGPTQISEQEPRIMERLIRERRVVALIDYHSGTTQVLYPYAYSTEARPDRKILGGPNGMSDYEVFRFVAGKIAALLNRHDRGEPGIGNYTAAQNYNGSSVASGVARDCYYATEGLAALNIEVHDGRYTYNEAEFLKLVPEICKTNVPGAVWFLFWAAELDGPAAGGPAAQ